MVKAGPRGRPRRSKLDTVPDWLRKRVEAEPDITLPEPDITLAEPDITMPEPAGALRREQDLTATRAMP